MSQINNSDSLINRSEQLTTSIKGKTVFMVLYNYYYCDYSIIKIMEKLEEAVNYIIFQEEKSLFYEYDDFKLLSENFVLVEVNDVKDIRKNYIDQKVNICYVKSGKYTFNLSGYAGYSSYIIVPIMIE